MELVPINLRDARRFVAEHHRHNLPPHGWRFGVGLFDDGELVGVAIAGRPIARLNDDGRTIEVTRVCVTEGNRNANSMLYGAVLRAAKALGYRRAITYTLPEESGSSLRAVGFSEDGKVEPGTWLRPNLDRTQGSHLDFDLFGNARRPQGEKIRWIRQLGSCVGVT